MITNLKSIMRNKNIKFLIFFLLTYRLAHGAVVHSSGIFFISIITLAAKLVKEGFPKEVLTYT